MITILCAALCLSGMPAQAEEALSIVHVTDMHYLSPSLTDYGETFMAVIEGADGKVTHYTPQLMQAFVDEMLALQPDAVILSGDLTFNGGEQSHQDLIRLLDPLTQAGIQVLALPGNHDTNTDAYQFEEPDVLWAPGLADERFDGVYATLGYANAIARDAASMSYVAQISPTVWCLMLDVNANGTAGTVCEETFVWMEEQLMHAQQEDITVIAVSHQPALIHNSLFTFGYVINNNTKLLDLYEKYGVKLNLCGHLHMQHVAESRGLTEIAASSLAVAPNQYGILRVQDGQLMNYSMKAVDMAGWAARSGQTDENLLDFTAYSAEFFNRTTRSQLEEMLSDSAAGEDEKQQMMDFAVALNAEYFSGRRTLSVEHPAWVLWQEQLPRAFFTYYMSSILAEPPQNMSEITFERITP